MEIIILYIIGFLAAYLITAVSLYICDEITNAEGKAYLDQMRMLLYEEDE